MQLKDLQPGEMFRRPTGTFRYIKGCKTKETGGGCLDYFCFNLGGQSQGYFMPGSQEVVRIDPTAEEEHLQPFWMCYVEGGNSPTMKHSSGEARPEAERLARKTGRRVYVMASVAYVDYLAPANAQTKYTSMFKFTDC